MVGVIVPDPPPPPFPVPLALPLPTALAPGLDPRINIIESIPGPMDCSARLVVLAFRDPDRDSDLDPGSFVNDPLPNPKIV